MKVQPAICDLTWNVSSVLCRIPAVVFSKDLCLHRGRAKLANFKEKRAKILKVQRAVSVGHMGVHS